VRRAPAAALLLATVLLGACAGSPATTSPAPSASPVDLTVFGAASLKGVLADAKAAYEAATPGVALTVSTDSSATLATQIEQGAPADVFLSADTKNPQRLVDGGFATGTPVAFAGNTLAVIVPLGNPAGITTPADLARPGVKVIAAGDAVPITTYANQLVTNLAKQPGYAAGFAAAYAANTASREDNVKSVVTKIELGEGDAAIVYVTDAAASKAVKTIAVPDAANVPATYSGVVVKASAQQAAAKAFLAWIAGPAGRAILGKSGFLPAP
jgi:molybdate transport system substrate-binding protein